MYELIKIEEIRVKEQVYSFFSVGESRELIVPETYRHDTFLDEFRKMSRKFPSFYMSDEINPKKYPQASQHLVPGTRLRISVTGIKTTSPVRISKCIKYLINKGAVFTNVHGLALAFTHCQELFQPGFAYYGLDLPEMLPRDSVDMGRGIMRSGYRHPTVHVPSASHSSFPRSLSHTLNERFGPLARFLEFQIIN